MKYRNPIIRGFNPDPSICCVGGDCYLVTSSFEYFPGIPVYHSTDLLNWKLIGHCITREEQLQMEGVKASSGIWAPTIRYSNGRFYVTATFNERGNFIVYTDNSSEEWSDPIWTDMDGIDPSIFFEDGKMYYCANDCGSRGGNGEGISLAEIDPETGKVKGEIKRIWTGTGGGFLEAPHIYHIGEWYYLLAAEGGSGIGHMTTAARCKSLFGEYETCPDNPILTNRHDTSKQVGYSGHSDLFMDNSGNWWIVHLAIRRDCGTMSSIGRETFLTPIIWNNDWPVVENNRKATLDVDAKINAAQALYKEWTADFAETEWEKEWLFLRKPQFENYERKNGCLCLKPSTVKITDETVSPTFAAVRKEEIDFTSEAELEFDTNEIGDEAGMVIYLSPDYHYRICKKREGGGDYISVEKTAEDFREIAFKEKLQNGRITLRIIGSKGAYGFYYASDGKQMKYLCSAKTKFLTCELAGKSFTGTVIGLYAQSDKETKSFARVYKFSMIYNR
ncbi:MAG: glycoside hydrolase family 43 protein [bacterium]|nr:glycoside hydrolase family 43 protein [bacterium]